MQTVKEKVVNSGLCIGCGTCEGVCSIEAIKMKINNKGFYIPHIDEQKCIGCGLCIKVCPGLGINFEKTYLKKFNKLPEDEYLGNIINTYIGYSTDKNIRYNSSSGGVVTALAIYAIKKGIVDSVIVTKLEEGKLPQAIITNDPKEILNSTGSKYAPVPVNVLLKQIIQERDEKKYLFIGLPCHIHGILKAEEYFPKLKEKIYLKIGLFCGGTPSFVGSDFILWLYGINEDIRNILKYRGEGWPGVFVAKTDDDNHKKISLLKYYEYLGAYYINPRCRLCIDHTAEFADISVGDPWLPDFKDSMGSTIITSMTERGEDLLQNAKKDSIIEFNEISSDKIFESQIEAILYKKSDLTSRSIALGLKDPNYGKYPSQGYPKYLVFLQTLIYSRLSSIFAYNKNLWPLLKLYHKTITKAFWLFSGRLKNKFKKRSMKKYDVLRNQ